MVINNTNNHNRLESTFKKEYLDWPFLLGMHIIGFSNLNHFLKWYFGDRIHVISIDDLDVSTPIETPIISKPLLYGRIDKREMWLLRFNKLFYINETELQNQWQYYLKHGVGKSKRRYITIKTYSDYVSSKRGDLESKEKKAIKLIKDETIKYFVICS